MVCRRGGRLKSLGDTFGSGHLWRGRVSVLPKGLLFTRQLLPWQTEEDAGQLGPGKALANSAAF